VAVGTGEKPRLLRRYGPYRNNITIITSTITPAATPLPFAPFLSSY
jgi:hypothetical protein